MQRVLLVLFSISLSCFAQTTNPAPNVFAWGDNSSGQCNVPPDLTNAIAIAAGWGYSMALRADGTLVEWGAPDSTPPPGLTNIVNIATGSMGQRMVVKADGSYIFWNNNWAGPITGGTNVVQIVGGNGAALVLLSDGTTAMVFSPYAPTPHYPLPGSNIVSIAAGGDFGSIFGLRRDGSVVYINVGMGSSLFPPSVTNAIAVAGDYGNGGMLLLADGTITGGYVAGSSLGGWFDYPITNYNNVVAIAGGVSGFMAVRADGTVVIAQDTLGPMTVAPELPFATAVSVGGGHYLAIVRSDTPVYPPVIVRQPLPTQTVPVGSFVLLSAMARGYAPLGYQWFFNQTNLLAGETWPSLRLTNVQPNQSGAYTVVVTNPVGSVTSAPALLSVAPVLDVQAAPVVYMTAGVGFTYSLQYINEVGPTNAWVTLTTLTITNSPELYIDFSAIGQPRRFYRLVQVP